MTVSKTFPLSSARIDGAKFAEKSMDPAIRSQTEGGYVITRPRSTRRPRRIWKIGFTSINDTDKASLQAFWNSVMGGSEAFNWTLPATEENVIVRFAEGNVMEFQYAGPSIVDDELVIRWNISEIVLEEV